MPRGSLFNVGTNSKGDESKPEERPFATHIKNFDAFFDKELAPEIEKLAKLRYDLWSKAVNSSIWMIALVILLMLTGMFFMRAGPPVLFLLIAAVTGSGIIVGINYSNQKKVYNTSFKEQVIKKMMYGIDDRLHFQPLLSISRNEYFLSQIFRKQVDRFDGEDLIEATIDKTSIKFSELHTQYKTETTNSKGRRQTNWHTIFKGVFFVADFNKEFQHFTAVLPDYNQQMFGDLFKGFQFGKHGNARLVNMDHPAFEKQFKVYADDAVEAHYLLTPNLMERIVQLKEKFDKAIYLSFSHSKLHVAISNSLNLFEAPALWGKPDFLTLVKTYHDYLHNCLEIVNDLNLNTRIWGSSNTGWAFWYPLFNIGLLGLPCMA